MVPAASTITHPLRGWGWTSPSEPCDSSAAWRTWARSSSVNVNREDCDGDGAPGGSGERGDDPPTPSQSRVHPSAPPPASGMREASARDTSRARDRTLESRAIACRLALRVCVLAGDDPGEPRCEDDAVWTQGMESVYFILANRTKRNPRAARTRTRTRPRPWAASTETSTASARR